MPYAYVHSAYTISDLRVTPTKQEMLSPHAEAQKS